MTPTRFRGPDGLVHETTGSQGAHSLMECETGHYQDVRFAFDDMRQIDEPPTCLRCVGAMLLIGRTR